MSGGKKATTAANASVLSALVRRGVLLLLGCSAGCLVSLYGACDERRGPDARKAEPELPGRSTPTRGRLITTEDLFGKERLSGRPPQSLALSDDGRTLFYLKPSAKDARVLDLWAYDVAARKASVLVRAGDVEPPKKVELTEAQAAAQERRRVRHRGITRFVLCKCNTSLLLSAGGRIFHFDLRDTKNPLKPLLPKPGGELDPKLSPDGKTASFVRGSDLFVVDVATGRQRRLTRTGSETLKNGVAEFAAAEELDRHTGYWWSADGKRIAFAQVDESPVGVVLRPKYSGRGVEVVRQRYPEAGTPNAKVKLAVMDLETGRVKWMDTGPYRDFYLARVKWVKAGFNGPDRPGVSESAPREAAGVQGVKKSKRRLKAPREQSREALAFQVLTRGQRRLELRLADPDTGKSRVVLAETDERYVNLSKDFRPLKKAGGFLWSSERSGFRQLYHHLWTGRAVRQISQRPLFVKKLIGVDEKQGWAYAEVPVDRGRQLHVYRFALDGGRKPQRITRAPGWHQGFMDRTGAHLVDLHSDLGVPPSATLCKADGEKVAVLHASRPERLKELALARRTFLDVHAADGTVLNALSFEPPGLRPGGRLPAVMYVYGGPHGHSVARMWRPTDLWHHYLAQRGFWVFLVDGRGTAHRGREFENKLHRRFGVTDVDDVIAGARALGKLPGVDPHRLGLWGWSYGGYLTVMTVLRSGRLFRAAAAVAPLADWRFYDTAYTERYLGHPETSKEVYLKSNALEIAGALRTDLLLIHGMADDNVLLRHTLLLAEAFQNHSVPFRMMLYPSKKHSIRGTAVRTHLMNLLHAHFKNALGGAGGFGRAGGAEGPGRTR